MKGWFKRSIARLLCLTTCVGAVATPLVACGPDEKEEPALVLATDALDRVFNPFFYTSGADGEIVGQTQIGMLSSDKTGKLIANWNEPCVALDFGKVKHGDPSMVQGNNYGGYYTDYYFALKDNIKFSDGQLLTKDDVLFNIYMYLDPAYTGSNTMYSVKIQGLTEYRTQTRDLSNAGSAESFFQKDVEGRMSAILSWIEADDEPTWADLKDYEYYRDKTTGVTAKADQCIESDIRQIQDYYKQSLDETWTQVISANIEEEYKKYIDKDGKMIITEPWQLYLYYYGFLTWDEHRPNGSNEVDYYIPKYTYTSSKHDKDSLIDFMYKAMFAEQAAATESYKKNLRSVMLSYPVNVYMNDYWLADVKHRKFKDNMDVKSVSGIEIIPGASTIEDQVEKDGGQTLETVTKTLKDAEGNPKSYDVLHIRINGVDPKAIQNFAFTVAPGHYYSTAEEWKKAVDDTDDNEYFGVKFSDPSFMNQVRDKLLPLGAGPYLASTKNGGKASTRSDFFGSNNIVYFERNNNFLLGAPKTKKLRYKVISNTQLYNAVKTGDVDYASPSMKREDAQQLENVDKNKLSSAFAENLGYGYIGVSARYIPNIYIRKAIMTTFDTSSIVDVYYGKNGASIINRPMSKTLSEYYTEEDPYYEFDEEGNAAKEYLEAGGCTQRNGKWYDEKGKQLKYTFTIAGDSDDHPAQSVFIRSAKILNDLGMDITVVHSSTALSKLASGLLTVWAAAWSSSSDPDMYQVYHKDSQATSTTAWGYKYIFSSEFKELEAKNNKMNFDDQRTIINDLSELIDKGRETDVVTTRREIYRTALNKLMELAVEFPTYQRKVYYVWRKGVFKESTLVTGDDVTSYQSPLSRIWEVEITKK